MFFFVLFLMELLALLRYWNLLCGNVTGRLRRMNCAIVNNNLLCHLRERSIYSGEGVGIARKTVFRAEKC